MRIVLLCDTQFNQIALANKIAARFQLAGIVLEKRTVRRKTSTFPQFVEKVLNRSVFAGLRNAWLNLLAHYKKQFPSFPEVASLEVSNINDPQTISFINSIKPDLLMISGTSIVKNEILGLPVPYGIINLHTGLSPYIKGGPNCTNWCIAENKMQLIGNTVMWVDAGIDSGDLITTSLTELTGDETLLELHIKVMDHAHKIYLDAVQKIQDDRSNCPRIKQSSIATGTVYYNRQWSWRAKYALIKNLKKMPAYFHSEQYQQDKKNVITVSL